jgi:hypothetical protein
MNLDVTTDNQVLTIAILSKKENTIVLVKQTTVQEMDVRTPFAKLMETGPTTKSSPTVA